MFAFLVVYAQWFAGTTAEQQSGARSHANTATGAGNQTSKEHVLVHMRAGEVFRAFIRLVHKAATLAQAQDESMPRLSPDQAPCRYIVIRPGQQRSQPGLSSNMAPGMMVRKVCITKTAFFRLQTHPPNADVERSMCANTCLTAV